VEGIRRAIRPDTRVGHVMCRVLIVKLIWLEVPTNPMLLVPPLPLIASIIDSLPRHTRPLVVIDTTFLSSFYITPLMPNTADGLPMADIALSSLSKYSGGHSDIILGSLTVSSRTASFRPDLLRGLKFLQNSLGASASPRDCHLMIRSLKTLGLRALRHGLNALHVAEWLTGRKEVVNVRYTGLKTDGAFHMVESLLSPNARHELEFLGWKFPYESLPGGQSGTLEHVRGLGIPFGGIVTFSLRGATVEQTDRFLTSLRLAVLAESLGGVETLIEAPYGMTHSVS
jgi:cystathionine gamma-lyase